MKLKGVDELTQKLFDDTCNRAQVAFKALEDIDNALTRGPDWRMSMTIKNIIGKAKEDMDKIL
jgi:hypothetical protein